MPRTEMVICGVCKVRRKSLLSHLKIHNLTKNEYLQLYKNAEIETAELKLRRSKKASEINTGRVLSEETKSKIANSVRTYYKNPNRLSWREIRRRVLLRDELKCQNENCSGKSKKLHVHHKDEDRNNSKMDNLITLCGSCHKNHHVDNELKANCMKAQRSLAVKKVLSRR